MDFVIADVQVPIVKHRANCKKKGEGTPVEENNSCKKKQGRRQIL